MILSILSFGIFNSLRNLSIIVRLSFSQDNLYRYIASSMSFGDPLNKLYGICISRGEINKILSPIITFFRYFRVNRSISFLTIFILNSGILPSFFVVLTGRWF